MTFASPAGLPLAVAITGHYDERSRYPAWSWVGAALAAVGAALAVTAVVDGIANGWNERTPWLMTGAAFSAVGAIPVYAIGTSMYQ